MMGEVDIFPFLLAEKLGMTLGEVRAMPNAEYEEWRAYHEVTQALGNMKERAGRRR
jgi:hypothetical protein